jgi:quinolinate synthase
MPERLSNTILPCPSAKADICCTSSNAVKIVSSIPEDEEILFIPDKSLGAYVSSCLNREMIYWDGYCPTHHRILADQIVKIKSEHRRQR